MNDQELEVAQDQYNMWKRHPVTELFRKFLRNYAAELERAHIGRWHSGKMDDDMEAEQRGRVAACMEMAELEFDHIVNFYNIEGEVSEGQDDQQDPNRAVHGERLLGEE